MSPVVAFREIRRLGLLPWGGRWLRENLMQPAREMTRRQLVVAATVGFWGGVFPFPPCTMPATLFCTVFYSAGVPRPQRFNVPMASVSVVINQLMLPLDLLFMPAFIMLGQSIYNRLCDAKLDFCVSPDLVAELKERPVEAIQRFGPYFGLGVMAWTAVTPFALGQIRMLGACASLATTR
mmetsp:Transcript_14264/g.39372  ORF Transcript_14264/g.39372 Transcript_14264/m.39372 type:complete len:180 (-) Transcript_14264:213-752(-)|eukprot:CAMPEP_0117533994 /NCGR_PEP_ID=MMETSP0784-20121206/40182_1 /TAXON_ID=39447 /ORGANISM="" /LENGTH=179 /DNA_ID=CAMNT_0005330459 /DNA_START=109 /DNA_END=648 /DNA_ORIENTATION=-